MSTRLSTILLTVIVCEGGGSGGDDLAVDRER